MQKKQRHLNILEVIRENKISTQTDLRKKLLEKGIVVDQSTLSRDISELFIGKDRFEIYKVADDLQIEFTSSALFKDAVISVVYAVNTVVFKCKSGMAQAVCAELDRTNREEIVGTLAGDDTIFALFKDEKMAAEFCYYINKTGF